MTQPIDIVNTPITAGDLIVMPVGRGSSYNNELRLVTSSENGTVMVRDFANKKPRSVTRTERCVVIARHASRVIERYEELAPKFVAGRGRGVQKWLADNKNVTVSSLISEAGHGWVYPKVAWLVLKAAASEEWMRAYKAGEAA